MSVNVNPVSNSFSESGSRSGHSLNPHSSTMTDIEWQTRCDLAALYRLLDHYEMTDMIYTHLSARLTDQPDTFLINEFGEMFDEVTASSLVKLDMKGNVVGESGNFNVAGFNIHSGVYGARDDVNCVIHTHTRAGVAVAATKSGLLPISQHSVNVMPELSYFDYSGPGTFESPEEIGAGCGKSHSVIMRNHGLLTSGHSIQAAFYRIYYLESACKIQCSAAAMGELQTMDDDVKRDSLQVYTKRQANPELGQREWPALLRMLDRKGSDYRR